MTPHEAISLKIQELDNALKTSHPMMPQLLQQIHANLKQDADVVTLLTPQEVSVIVTSLCKQTEITIATSVLKGDKGKKMNKISVDDI